MSDCTCEKTLTKKRKPHVIVLVCLLTGIAIIAAFAITQFSSKNRLKYSWRTALSYIEQQEYVYALEGDYIKCEDPRHTVDKLSDFSIDRDFVRYLGCDTPYLQGITYTFEEMTFARRVMIVEAYYGKEYCVVERFNEKYYSDVVWYKGDTVIVLGYDSIAYYDANYFWENGPGLSDKSFEMVKRFFDMD